MKRRDFIKTTLAGGAAISVLPYLGCGKSMGKPIPKRRLGKTGENLSIIGFGGIVVMDEEQKMADRYVSEAVDRGINYFDVAPAYGNAQEKLGPALHPYRSRCFLACKTENRDRDGAEKDLSGSLHILQTDHLDLYQLHALTTMDEVNQVFGPNGAMEVLLKAKQEGRIRFLGFSAHSEEAALAAMERFDFDTILFPVNFVCWFKGNFGPKVVARAKEKSMGILALKAMAYTQIGEGEPEPFPKCWYKPIEDPRIQALALRFTLSQGTTAVIPPGEPRFFWRAVDAVQDHSPITEPEIKVLMEHAKKAEPVFKTA